MVGPTTNHRLERAGDIQRLERAKLHLKARQVELHTIRRRSNYYPSVFLRDATLDFYAALDRVWIMQCMVNGVFE